jgi:hypothetical protein
MELIALGPDVVMAATSAAVAPLRQVTSTVPIRLSIAGLLEISDIQGNQLGAAECAGKAEQQQSAVSECGES